jgi:hypothetical protein
MKAEIWQQKMPESIQQLTSPLSADLTRCNVKAKSKALPTIFFPRRTKFGGMYKTSLIVKAKEFRLI